MVVPFLLPVILQRAHYLLTTGIVLPVAIVILGTQVQSYRHMFIALVNLLCTLLLAFSWLVPITDHVAINPFAPSIMMSLGIAISFDYSLFMLTRFRFLLPCNGSLHHLLTYSFNREEIIENKKSTADAVYSALLLSGHVVILSGCTLFVTFALLIGFPQNFLQSVGWGCGAVIISAIFCNLTVTPTLLLTFQCFSTFELYPNCSCLFAKKNKDTVEYKGVDGNASNQQVTPTTDSGDQHQIEEQAVTTMDNKVFEGIGSMITPRTWWFRISFFTSAHCKIILLVVCAVTIPFIIEFLKMIPTSDDELVYLRGSNSLAALQIMKSDFPMGQMDPYSIICTTDISSGVLTADYFTYEQGLISKILQDEQPKYIDTESITALSYYNGDYVSYSTAMAYFDSTSNVYSDSIAVAYRIEVGSSLNSDSSATLIKIETIINPNSQSAAGFVVDMRHIIDKYESETAYGSTMNQVKLYLFGAYTSTLDVQNALYATVPTLIGCTIAIVLSLIFFSFGSIMIAVRLAITVFISLSWTYGLMVYVYQPGPSQDDFAVLNPALHSSTGIYWIIPIMSFSILVGLALDYDIFLMSRVMEFRKLGWSDRAAICLAIEKTGSIITAAGVIMSVSFAGLLLPKSTVLNQYGFSLFVGVMLDTFIVRTIVVPVIFSAFDIEEHVKQFNWYPTVMPAVILTPEEEERQLFAGYWVPQVDRNQDGKEGEATNKEGEATNKELELVQTSS